jgi:hypothetical protein
LQAAGDIPLVVPASFLAQRIHLVRLRFALAPLTAYERDHYHEERPHQSLEMTVGVAEEA